jgi:hypothetical protein
VAVDLVAHDGGDGRGEVIQTLTLTDVATGWTVFLPCRNKAQKWVFEALQQLAGKLPFPLRALHADNGAEFLNHHLLRSCTEAGIRLTRSRPYRKNDNCYAEQKNGAVVRRPVGYGRLSGEQALQVLHKLAAAASDLVNFFVPSMKLVAKQRQGAKVKKRYDRPQTPYQRVLASPHIPETTKQALRAYAQTLNPVALMATIRQCQHQLHLLAANAPKPQPTSRAVDGAGLRRAGNPTPSPGAPHPLEIAPRAIPTPPTAPTTKKPKHPNALT